MHYRSRVEKILTEADPAGRGDRADVVISAADGHATILNMLEGRFISEKIRGYYEKRSHANPSARLNRSGWTEPLFANSVRARGRSGLTENNEKYKGVGGSVFFFP
jgi:hypothetical protein